MEFKEIKIEQIVKHEEFNEIYMESLHVCGNFLTKDEKKNNDYCSKQCKNDCYKKQKHYFEQYCGLVRNPETMYFERVKNSNLSYVTPPKMMARYICFSKFLNVWIRDVHKAQYSKIDFYPDTSKCPKDEFNQFDMYEVKRNYQMVDETKRHQLVAPILKHFKDIFETKEEGDFIIKSFAHGIQFPMDKNTNGVSIVIQGDQGTGKSTLLELFLVPIIGNQYYTYTANPNDVCGEHAEGLEHRLVAVLDEVQGKSTFNLSEFLKSLTTQTTLTVNPKGIRPYQIKNYCRIYFTTNNKTPIKIEIGDRRYAVFKMLNTYRCNREYFKGLAEYMKQPDVLSAWYDYLMSLDVVDYDFCANRPQTQIYNDIVEACLSNVTKYVEYLMTEFYRENPKEVAVQKVMATNLFANYNKWKEETKHKDDHTSCSFGRAIKDFQGVKSKRLTAGIQYIFDFDDIKEYFKTHNIFGFTNKKQIVEDIDNDNDDDVKITINIFKQYVSEYHAEKEKTKKVDSDKPVKTTKKKVTKVKKDNDMLDEFDSL